MNFRNLDVYRLAIRFVGIAARCTKSIPIGHSDLGDQLRRASLSVPLNIAEGSGRMKAPDQRRYYSIARGSAMECAAIIDACAELDFLEEPALEESIAMLTSIVRMLSKLALDRPIPAPKA